MRHPLTVYAIVMLHLTWGVLLLASGGPLWTTAIDGVVRFFHPYYMAAWVLIFAGLCGILGIRLFERYRVLSLVSFFPMQFLLFLSKITIITAIVQSHFADGVIRSRYFIGADQCYLLIIGSLYTYAILVNFGGWKQLKRQ